MYWRTSDQLLTLWLGSLQVFIPQPDKVHMYCTIQSMKWDLQGHRRLHVEVGRQGSFRRYDTHGWSQFKADFYTFKMRPNLLMQSSYDHQRLMLFFFGMSCIFKDIDVNIQKKLCKCLSFQKNIHTFRLLMGFKRIINFLVHPMQQEKNLYNSIK